MDIEEFWELIATIGGYPPDDEVQSFLRLEVALAAKERAEIFSFEDHLAEMLYKLDRRSFAEVRTIDTGRTQSSDSFLYNRCAVIVAGEAAYRDVLSGARSFQSFTHSHAPNHYSTLHRRRMSELEELGNTSLPTTMRLGRTKKDGNDPTH
jgi:hypothetical protein